MIIDDLQSLSPLDGRYKNKTVLLRKFFSESALISYRIKVEIAYIKLLSKYNVLRSLTKSELIFLNQLHILDLKKLKSIKKFENQTHHDVKAIEYFLRDTFQKTSLKNISQYIHFAITSEDINNLSYRMMISDSLKEVIVPEMKNILIDLNSFSSHHSSLAMLARTHGQAAIPTTLGKEFVVFELRLIEILSELKEFKFKGKFNGAVGGYHAMHFSYPKINWKNLSKDIVTGFNFEHIDLTTQIAPADDFVKLFSIFHRFNNILIGLNQDIWRYISDGWLIQANKEKFVGSSTMPQKINPIEFENSEGNLSVANSLFEGFIRKLPMSRLQRDLSESTVLRNFGSAFGYCLIAYKSLISGVKNLGVDRFHISASLNENFNILLEAWQTELRKIGDSSAYEKAARMGKNKTISKNDWKNLTKSISNNLSSLNPENYLGLTIKLARESCKKVEKFIKIL